MTKFTKADFPDLTSETFDETMASGFGPDGTPGTAEHALNVAECLAEADDMSHFVDYETDAEQLGYAHGAAVHANITSLQSAAAYAGKVMRALAANPELLEQVQAAIVDEATASPKL